MTEEYMDYLAHHGVIGQKWGKRRYQNEDGTLTPEGKQRRNKEAKQPESDTWRAKDAKYLSDDELNRRNARLQKENQYRQLTQSDASKALKWIGRTASTVLVASAIAAGKGNMGKVYSNFFKSVAGRVVSRIAKYRAAGVI